MFSKHAARTNASFDAGFYWYDPIWLDGTPDDSYVSLNARSKKDYHKKYKYSIPLIKSISPEENTIMELSNKNQLDIYQKLIAYPQIGDEKQDLHIITYREFDMTNDADLFHLEKIGWPLYQGGTIHFYNAHFKEPERYIISTDGEDRLATKWRCDKKDLPGRKYRIAWRGIAQPTDSRSLICTILPRGVFVGNSLSLININIEDDELLSGVNVVLSSFVADFYVRSKIAKNINAFILKTLPMFRNKEAIRSLGNDAMPLYSGNEFETLRNGKKELKEENERIKLMASLDARVAHLYGLSFEDYQIVLSSFPLIDEDYKQRCIYEFRELMFSC